MATPASSDVVSPPPVVGSPAFQQPLPPSLLLTPSPLFPTPMSSLPQTPSPLFATPLSSLMQTPSPFFPTRLSSVSVEATSNITAATASGNLKPMARRYSGVILRSLAIVFCFISSLALAIPPPKPHAAKGEQPFSFKRHPEFNYCLSAVILSSVYSAVQLLKTIYDELPIKGVMISDKTYEYLTFFLDQAMSYLLFSSSSVAVVATGRITRTTFLTSAIISLVMSFAAFVAIATSTVQSGYQLSKRIIW